ELFNSARSASAGGQLEHPSEVNNSTSTGLRGPFATGFGSGFAPTAIHTRMDAATTIDARMNFIRFNGLLRRHNYVSIRFTIRRKVSAGFPSSRAAASRPVTFDHVEGPIGSRGGMRGRESGPYHRRQWRPRESCH